MFKFKTLALAYAMFFAIPSFAQSSSDKDSADIATSYNIVGASYTNVDLNPKDGYNTSLNGFSVNYLHGFSLSRNLPMYLETGIKFSMGFEYNTYKDFGYVSSGLAYQPYTEDVNFMLASIAVPANFAWRFKISDRFTVKPYAGLNLKLHVLGKSKYSYKSAYDEWQLTENWFDKDDMGQIFNRVQIGWHIGAGFQYSKIYIGVAYGTDFSKLTKDMNSATFDVALGYCF